MTKSVPKEVADLIGGSGNNFHAKVARWFQANGWHTTVSPYYMDQSQSKAREIDLVVERAWPVKDAFGTPHGHVLVRLFVECKFVPQSAVFWFADKDLGEAVNLVCSNGLFGENNSHTHQHHYVMHSARVAKLFASNVQKGQELEPFYKALNQVLNAMVSMRRNPPLLPAVREDGALLALDFPVVVCSSFDSLWGVDFYNESEPAPLAENFQLEVRYAYADAGGRSRDDYFLLDFVEFGRLEDFIKLISHDAVMASYLKAYDL